MEKSIHREEYKALLRLLYQKRMQAGIKQEELARRLGVHQFFISKTENGDRRIDLVELMEYCAALGVDLEDLVKDFLQEVGKGE